jgi:hypothetical protein
MAQDPRRCHADRPRHDPRRRPVARRRGRPVSRAVPGRAIACEPDDPRSPGEVWRTALRMIGRHGAAALQACADRADDSLDAGDRDSWVIWYRVLHAIARLQATAPAEGEAVH